MKTLTFRVFLGVVMGLCLVAGAAWGTCAGDEEVAGEWIFEEEADGWAVNTGFNGDVGNLGLTGGAAFSTNVPLVNCDCGHSLLLPGTNGTAGAVSINDYDPLAGAEKFSILAWVRRDGADGANLSARVFSDTDSTALTNTTSGVEFRFSGNAGNLALRVNGTEVSSTVGGISPTNGEWHHVAVVYDGTRAATNYATRNVQFYVDGIQRGVGSVLQGAVVATNYAPVVVGNASPSRAAANLLAGHIDDVLVVPGWAPAPVGNGNTNEFIRCFMESNDDIFPPILVAPADIEAEAAECLAPVAVALGSASTWENCGGVIVTNDAPALFGIGVTGVTWTARDAAGNEATAVQSVVVMPSRTGDCDEDGLTDYEEEMELETDSALWDTDGDGWGDGEEVAMGFNPTSAGDCPKVTIHAVSYNPSGTDTGKEWVEVYSASRHDVSLDGFRLEVGRPTGWDTVLAFPVDTALSPGHCLLVGESSVTNADLTATLDIPNAWTNEPATGLRLVRGTGTNAFVLDAVFIGGGVPFNSAQLDATGWQDTNSVWAHAGAFLERRFPGVDTDTSADWHEVSSHVIHNSADDIDSDGDGIPDGDEWAGVFNPFGEPTNPWNADSDGDGLSDYDECFVHLTNPNAWATDGDLYPFMPPGTSASSWPGSDSYEISHNWNPKVRDQNGNGIPDSWEMALGLDTLLSGADSDSDGIDNLTELRQNSNPLDPADFEDKPFALVFESSAPDWVNGAPDNDVGFGGWVQLHVTGASEGDCIIVAVSEGNVPEEFSIRWKGADRSETTWNPSKTSALTVAWMSGDATLVVKDNAMHSDFTGSLGGEYTFQFYRGNLDAKRIAHNADAGFLPNALEMAPGAFLPVNDDDDDYDEQHAPDKDEAGRVEGETDLLPIVLRAASPASAGGTYTLNIPAHVRVWQNADRIGSVTPATEFSASVDTTLYVEAVAKGSGPLKLNWQNTLFNVVAVDNVRVTAFEWAGPLNVPDYSIHRYTASGAQAGSRWIAPVGGTIHEGADTSEIRIFWGPGPIVGKAVYQATSDYIWDLEVNVVQILIASPEHTFVAGDPYFAGAKIIGTSRVAFVTSYRDPVPGLWWQADVSLCGPSDNRGVSRMKVGFIQNLIGYLNRGHYQNQESILIADIEAMTPLLDCAEGMAPWIYDDDSDSIFFDASETNLEKRIFTWDDPGDGCPVAFSQTLNPGNDDDLLTRMEFRDDFQLNVCVQTRDTQNDADKVYIELSQPLGLYGCW